MQDIEATVDDEVLKHYRFISSKRLAKHVRIQNRAIDCTTE
jgi:hypothetical protein